MSCKVLFFKCPYLPRYLAEVGKFALRAGASGAGPKAVVLLAVEEQVD
jgi:hypothetical protein